MDISKIEKVELHCHIDGILNHIMLQQMNVDKKKYSNVIMELQKICPVSSFADWVNEYYKCISPLVENNAEFLLLLLDQYLENLIKQNVTYSEVILASFLFQFDELDRQLELYDRFLELARKYRKEGLRVEYLIAVGRTKDRQKFERKVERIKRIFQLGYIRGIAIAGFEEEDTVKPYTDLFKELNAMGLGIEIHAGEWTGAEFIWEALEYGFADRIGHGLSMFDDPKLVTHIKERNIHIEFCPSSNFILTGINSIDQHPIRMAIENGIKFSINTDDPGPFCCDLNGEFALVQKAFSLKYSDFESIRANSLAASFAEKKYR